MKVLLVLAFLVFLAVVDLHALLFGLGVGVLVVFFLLPAFESWDGTASR